jgi:hypothetical protein
MATPGTGYPVALDPWPALLAQAAVVIAARPGTATSVNPYGWDLSCVNDLTASMTEVGGNIVLAQSCARRLITARGTLVDDANYGYDITQFLGDDLDPVQVGKIQANIAAELLKDERVQSVRSVAILSLGGVLTVTAIIEGASGPFAFVLSVSDLAATIVVSPT